MLLNKKREFYRLFCALCVFASMPSYAEVLPLNDALRATYVACVGIDDSLADLKRMAGINTAITGVGTGLGAGATVIGLVKEKKDKLADQIKLEKLNKIAQYRIEQNIEDSADEDVVNFAANMKLGSTSGTNGKTGLEKLDHQSKKLGNWRTGLMAGNTVTNVAGAIIAGNNRVDDDLQTQIDNCKSAVKDLEVVLIQAKIEGVDISEAKQIYDTCKEYNYVDISKINNRAKGATISSIIGTATGVTGTVTSAIANSNSVRNQGVGGTRTDKEKDLNAASNVLAGASTVASATATVFNATQIKAIKDVASVASKCTVYNGRNLY